MILHRPDTRKGAHALTAEVAFQCSARNYYRRSPERHSIPQEHKAAYGLTDSSSNYRPKEGTTHTRWDAVALLDPQGDKRLTPRIATVEAPLVRTIHVVPAPRDADADWEVHWATFVFEAK